MQQGAALHTYPLGSLRSMLQIQIDYVTTAHVTDDGTVLAGGASGHGVRYGIVLVAADPADTADRQQ